MPSLMENGKFKRHQKYALNDSDIAYVVVHFSPKSVTEHPRFAANFITKITFFLRITIFILVTNGGSTISRQAHIIWS